MNQIVRILSIFGFRNSLSLREDGRFQRAQLHWGGTVFDMAGADNRSV